MTDPTHTNETETAIYLSHSPHIPHWRLSAEDEKEHLAELKRSVKSTLWSKHGQHEDITVYYSRLYGQHIYWADAKKEDSSESIVVETVVQLNQLSYKPSGKSFQAPVQISIWRDRDDPETVGIPMRIFTHLFEQYGCIMSDATQTVEGRTFWQLQTKVSLSKGETVLAVTLDSVQQLSHHIVDFAPVTRLGDIADVYGGPDRDEERLLILRDSVAQFLVR